MKIWSFVDFKITITQCSPILAAFLVCVWVGVKRACATTLAAPNKTSTNYTPQKRILEYALDISSPTSYVRTNTYQINFKYKTKLTEFSKVNVAQFFDSKTLNVSCRTGYYLKRKPCLSVFGWNNEIVCLVYNT